MWISIEKREIMWIKFGFLSKKQIKNHFFVRGNGFV